MKPKVCYAAFNRNYGPFGNSIAWVSLEWKYKLNPKEWWRLKEIPSHARIGFVLEDGRSVYLEAREFEKTGISGPFLESKIEEWKLEDPRRWSRKYYLDLPLDSVEEMFDEARDKVGKWKYSMSQNVAVWWHRLTGMSLPRTLERVNCSEFVSYILEPNLPIGWRREKRLDEITPYDLECIIIDHV